MTVIADFLARAKTIDVDAPIASLDRRVVQELEAEIANGDVTLPAANFDGQDEVQTLAASGASSGTFDLVIRADNVAVAVAGLAYNAAPAAIQTALDSAADGVIPDYAAGDITVGGAGTADLNTTTFTYDGDSVSARLHPLSDVDGSGLTGGGTEAITQTTAGYSQRNVWAIFNAYSLVSFGATPPTHADTVPSLTKILDKSTNRLSEPVLRALALEAEVQDKIPGLEAALLDAFGLNPRPPASSQG